jgi:hypothetical protein
MTGWQADTVGAVPFLISIGKGAMLLNETLGATVSAAGSCEDMRRRFRKLCAIRN